MFEIHSLVISRQLVKASVNQSHFLCKVRFCTWNAKKNLPCEVLAGSQDQPQRRMEPFGERTKTAETKQQNKL